MKEMPLVSVILAVYNGERFLRETIDSILQQTYTNLEVIIVDDASTDTSRDIIDTYEDDRIIRVYKEKNENICCASNLAFDMAKGKYCAIIGHDDVWHLDKLEKQVAYMEAHNDCGVCFTRCNIVNHKNEIINEESSLFKVFNSYENRDRYNHMLELFCQGNRLCAPSAVIRTEDLHKVGGYDYSLLQWQDFELWLRILTVAEMYIIEEALVDYRQILDTKTNISADCDKTRMRGDHELAYAHEKFLYYLSDEDFKKTMSIGFLKKDASSKEDLQCERMFLLKRMKNPLWNRICSNLLNDELIRSRLETEYGFSVQDFYKCNTEILFQERANENPVVLREKIRISTENFIEYMDAFIAADKIETSIKFLLEVGKDVIPNSTTDTLCVIYEIYDREKQLGETSIFTGKKSVKELVECYETLKTLVHGFETENQEEGSQFAEFVVQNQISSSAILFAVEQTVTYKIAVINKVSIHLFENNQHLLALRLLKFAYSNSKDDNTIFNLAYVLFCYGQYESAAQVLNQISIESDIVIALKTKINECIK